MPTIRLENINKTFFPNTNREYHALRNLSLTINEGDFITIIGGNGAGKSTLLNAIAGSFKIDSGDILFAEKSVAHLSEHSRTAYVSRVFQNPLYGTAPRMTVAENMALASRCREHRGFRFSLNSENKKLFESELIKLELGLEKRLDTEMGLLSGGQRQAISLLMATMKHPDLLLLDEHTSALDPKTQRMIMALTDKQIKEKKMTALMITHNIQDALEYGNRMIVLHQGELVYDFSSTEKQQLTKDKIYHLFDTLQII